MALDEKKYTVASLNPRIQPFLDTVIGDTGFDVTFVVAEGKHTHPDLEDPQVVVKFSGSDVDLLLSNRAEILLCLEHLTMEVLRMPADEHSLVCFDANDYRILRMEELRMSAVTAADRVKKTGAPFHFSPMSSRERRIIHLSLRNEPEVRSESTGLGPIRQVVVVPASMKGVPEPIRPPRPRDEGERPRFGGGSGRGGRPGDRRGGPPRPSR